MATERPMKSYQYWFSVLSMTFMCACALGLCLRADAQQPNPQQENTATSPHPRHSGPKLLKGPPLGIGDRVGAFHIQEVSAYEALQNVSRKYNVVIGMEGVVYKTDPKISLDFSGGTVADLLNAIVAEAPDYRWQNDDGIIHVFRNGARAPLVKLVLNYPGASQKDRYEIWREFHTLPEYVGWMKSYQCRPLERIRLVDFRFDDGPIDIAAGQMTVGQLLDQVAKKSGDGFWAVLQSDPSDPVCHVSVIDWSW
jgi:hypothetical protein